MTDILNLPSLGLPTDEQFRIDGKPGLLELDLISFERFIESVSSGVIVYLEDPTPLLLDHGDELGHLFALHVTKPPMSRYVVDHRAFAIAGAVKDLVARYAVKPVVVPSVPRAIGNLEMWTAERRESFPVDTLTDQQVDLLFDRAFLLSPEQVEKLTGVSRAVLSNWRSANTGPKFFHAGGRSSVRYPALAVLSWLEGQ